MKTNEEISRIDELRLNGKECFQNGQYVDALKIYEEAFNAMANDESLATNISFTCFKLGEFEASLYWANRSIEINDTFLKGYYRRAVIYEKFEKYEEAKKDVLRILEKEPNNSSVLELKKKIENKIKLVKFYNAIHAEKLELNYELIDKMPIPVSYEGPKIEKNIDLEFVKNLIEWFKKGKNIDRKTAYLILFRSKEIFEKEKTLTRVNIEDGTKMIICGDTHGQFYDTANIFETIAGYPSETQYYLFNGDFVDRGPNSVENLLMLFSFKILYPKHFFISRGNHEFASLNTIYGLKTEVLRKYDNTMFDHIQTVFQTIPLSFLIQEKIFVVHGGIPIDPNCTIEEIERIDRFQYNCPDNSIMQELLWSDPQEKDGFINSTRGAGYFFGPDITKNFIQRNNILKIIRSHEYKPLGYEVSHNSNLITIFSAPNYYPEQPSSGAIIQLLPDLTITFKSFDSDLKRNTPP